MPYLIVQVLEMIVPPIVKVIVNHYERKLDPTPEETSKLQAHQAALQALIPKKV